MKGYFNSSDPARQRDWKDRCKDVTAVNATCPIPDVTTAPDGNVSARTFFFSKQSGEAGNQTVSGGSGKKSEASIIGAASVWEKMILTIVMLLYAVWIHSQGL